jgi:hypothetical protein
MRARLGQNGSLVAFGVPGHLHRGLVEYVVEEHYSPGHFLSAVLRNEVNDG